MNEHLLKSFLQIIAFITSKKKGEIPLVIKKHVESFLERNYGKKNAKKFIIEYDNSLNIAELSEKNEEILKKTCTAVNNSSHLSQKLLLLLNILSFYSATNKTSINSQNEDIIDKVASLLNISEIDYLNCKFFSSGKIQNIPQKENLLIIAENNPNISSIKFRYHAGINGYVIFMYIPDADLMIFTYNGSTKLFLNNKPIFSKHIYTISDGIIINGENVKSLYFGKIVQSILHEKSFNEITLSVNNISYSYKYSSKGVKNISFSAKSGDIVAIMGGSGVGKSTLLKLISGNLTPQQGEILLNGKNINKLSKIEKGIFGVMHQEESIVEELTVFENLLYSATLTIGNKTNAEIVNLVEEILFRLDLIDCQNNRVGSPGNRQLSGGQRKRLAIAMELIREPKILLVDEPTSGLSSSDSESVMKILKDIALQGKLVIVNIHQPSSEIYKLFDSLIFIDKGGIPIYWGNPTEAIIHFKTLTNRLDKNTHGCEYCGNIKPELIFEIVEEQTVDEMGYRTLQRKVLPSEWFESYQKQVSSIAQVAENKKLPNPCFVLPNTAKQFTSFFNRNFLAKIRNIEFVILSIFLPPIVAVLIAVFLRSSIPFSHNEAIYNFYFNPNLASFFLMCILASLFFGIILSCDDIIKDNQLIVREKYLGLNLKCFYNSKIGFLILQSAYQTFSIALLGSLIMGLKGMLIHLWLILFSLSLFGNLLGLIISSTLKSIVAIYILVPFLLIPQILFSGLVVRFDSLNPRLTNEETVPIAGELMASRWASEALITHFYSSNKFNAPFFDIDFIESQLRYKLLILLPEVQYTINLINDESDLNKNKTLIINGINQIKGDNKFGSNNLANLSLNDFKTEATLILHSLKNNLANNYSTVKQKRDKKVESLYSNTEKGRSLYKEIQFAHHNKSIDELVRNKFYPKQFVTIENEYVQKVDPIFHISKSNFGRSHFFAPYKQVYNTLIKTFWFNTLIIWIMLLTLYFSLLIDIFPKIGKSINNKAT